MALAWLDCISCCGFLVPLHSLRLRGITRYELTAVLDWSLLLIGHDMLSEGFVNLERHQSPRDLHKRSGTGTLYEGLESRLSARRFVSVLEEQPQILP